MQLGIDRNVVKSYVHFKNNYPLTLQIEVTVSRIKVFKEAVCSTYSMVKITSAV